MGAGIIAVGTELLLGQTVNTNITSLSEQLADLGIEVYYQTVVGDNQQRLGELIALTETRSKLALLCGGLGPTEGNLTEETAAAHLDKSLIQNTEGCRKLLAHFGTTHRKMTRNNLQQPQIIEGGVPLPNCIGFALGTFYQTDTYAYILLPGSPNELKPVFVEQACLLLEERFLSEEKLISKVLRFYGIGESRLVTELKDLIKTQINPTIASYAKPSEVTLQLTVRTNDVQVGNQALLTLEEKIQERVGEYFYGCGDDNSLTKIAVGLLKENKQAATAAESLTVGVPRAVLGDIAGIPGVSPGGFVAYSLQTKVDFLEIDPELLAEHGAVSKERVEQTVIQTCEIARTDHSVTFTGMAGPDTLEGQSAGTVQIAISSKDGVVSEKYHFARDRAAIRYSAVMQGFDPLRKQSLRK